jgi:hypothetical protein
MTQSNIKILWNNDGKWIFEPYEYDPKRPITPEANPFLKNTFLTLDFIYEKKALELEFPDGRIVSIIDEFTKRHGKNLIIKDGENNQYEATRDIITFYDNVGSMFRKDLKKPWIKSNIGRNTAASILAHELIHAYHDQFEYEAYRARKNKKYPLWKTQFPHFPNEEEVLVTLNLGNQAIRKLGDDQRSHYKRNYYPTISPISLEPTNPESHLIT